jgi:hypothetical protein
MPYYKVSVLMWWKRHKAPEKTRQEQLLEARYKLQRQLETLRMEAPLGNPAYVTNTPALIAQLSEILADIESELANYQPRNGETSQR